MGCAIITRVTAVSAVASRAGTPAGQVVGLLLVLAPAVVATGTASGAARVVAVLAGLIGAATVFGGLYHRLTEPAPDGVDDPGKG